MKKVNGIVFAQAADSKKAVVADKYVAHELYVRNKEIIEALGGEIIKGIGGFRAEFPTVAKAKQFIAEGITKISKTEYNATRKMQESKPVEKPKTSAKSKKSKASNGKGASVPTKSATVVKETKKPARKSKGNAELTEAGKKALDRMKASVLNRAASAYSIANGGEATTFSALGKSAKELSAYIPKAKEGLLKSPKWAKAVELGVTEDMLD